MSRTHEEALKNVFNYGKGQLVGQDLLNKMKEAAIERVAKIKQQLRSKEDPEKQKRELLLKYCTIIIKRHALRAINTWKKQKMTKNFGPKFNSYREELWRLYSSQVCETHQNIKVVR
jgi:hypothetical protein